MYTQLAFSVQVFAQRHIHTYTHTKMYNKKINDNEYLVNNLHVGDSLEVRFTKFANVVFRNPIFYFSLEKFKVLLSLRSLGKLL